MNFKKMTKREVVFTVVGLLISTTLSAQIKLAEDESPQPKEPEWLKYKDVIYAPYDSLYLSMECYPTLSAYEKYIGQQLFLPLINDSRHILYSDKMTIKKAQIGKHEKAYLNPRKGKIIDYLKKPKDNIITSTLEEKGWRYDKINDQFEIGDSYIWNPLQDLFESTYATLFGYTRPDYYNDPALVSNKYYSIIGILSVTSDEFQKHHKSNITYYHENGKGYNNCYSMRYSRIRDHTFAVEREEVPYFIMKEVESGDTVYTAFPEDFILVGGFIKQQQMFIGQNFFYITSMPGNYNINNNLIKGKWKCIDVVLKEKNIVLVLQNINEPAKEEKIAYNRPIRSEGGIWITETEYNKAFDEVLAELAAKEKAREEVELKQNQKNIAYKNQQEQEKIKRKQNLSAKYGAATAEKIIAGKLEIGMSKSVCKEIVRHEVVVDKTATTETWKIASELTNGATHLYFQNDKLTRISNR